MRLKTKVFSFFLLYLFFYSFKVKSQDCGCTHVINPTTAVTVYDGATKIPVVGPGSVICLKEGSYNRVIFKNLIGSANNPVVLKNCGGTADISLDASTTASVLDIRTSRYLKISGLGDTSISYGIKVHGGGDSGLTVGYLSSDVEIEGVEVFDKGFAGMMLKTDPSCADAATWRENFTMYNLSVHDNYVHDVAGEGFYIGNSFYVTGPASTSSCIVAGDVLRKKAHIIEGVEVYNNVVRRTGCEGIQVGSTPVNCSIHDNIIDITGLSPFANFQNNGLQIGNGTGGLVYNNIIKDSPGNGISCVGIGDNFIYNNLIINSGFGEPPSGSTTYGSAIFMDEQAHEAAILGSGMKIVNNTIINPTENAFRIYNDRISNTLIQNNLVIKSGVKPYVYKLNPNVNLTEITNLYFSEIPNNLFTDVVLNDYSILEGSAAAASGSNTINLGFTYDINNKTRTTNDIGAYVANKFIGENTTTATNCGSYTWIENGQTYTQSGTYEFVQGTVTKILNLTITPATENVTPITACGSYTWANTNQTYTTSGVYTGTTANCVIEKLNVTITPATSNTITVIKTCDSYTWPENGQTYTESGNYLYDVDCELKNLNLTITPTQTLTSTVSVCEPYFWASDGKTYTQSGTYEFTKDCTKNILQLTVNDSFVAEIQKNTESLLALPANASYQWYKCPNVLIAGATNQMYVPTESGEYKVQITTNACQKTTKCIPFELFQATELVYFPNPTNDIVTIQNPEIITSAFVYDIAGRKLLELKTNDKQIEIDLSSYSNTAYFLLINTAKGQKIIKIVRN